MDSRLRVICHPVQGMDAPVEGSVTRVCTGCGGVVWFSPQSQELEASDRVGDIRCYRCAVAEMAFSAN